MARRAVLPPPDMPRLGYRPGFTPPAAPCQAQPDGRPGQPIGDRVHGQHHCGDGRRPLVAAQPGPADETTASKTSTPGGGADLPNRPPRPAARTAQLTATGRASSARPRRRARIACTATSGTARMRSGGPRVVVLGVAHGSENRQRLTSAPP